MQEPRAYHLRFSAVALPQISFRDPLTFFTMAASPEGGEHIGAIWAMVCADEGAPETETRLASDIGVNTRRIRGFPTLLIRLPEPRCPGEAHFAGFVLLHDIEAELERTNVTLRYFSLECAPEHEGTGATRLCEWTRDLERLDHGAGPPPSLDAFVEGISAIV